MALSKDVVVFDYGSGNVRSAVRALEHIGARVELTADPERALACDGLLVPGVGNFHTCMAGLAAVHGPRIIERRLAGGRPVLGICVGMQVMFDGSDEPAEVERDGLAQWPGRVARLPAPIVPHMGWSEIDAPAGSRLLHGLGDQRFYFVHSYAVQDWIMPVADGAMAASAPLVTWSEHGAPFVAAVENGVLSATQFHPEKSGDAGLHLLKNWVTNL
ncbi:imidazole glycerol phosphate synthase subunit HisH [Kribbia dieselivorans]|uniref:imidazole glycerol phosphate synthase subunit HisH n=1 Tax=Kribbia dieselivorans TaxID=331526 RepID=UPI00083998BD|nr:imidazole glycerol phosphate synthase subunit HisH [Kribbia dieselivorans]